MEVLDMLIETNRKLDAIIWLLGKNNLDEMNTSSGAPILTDKGFGVPEIALMLNSTEKSVGEALSRAKAKDRRK